LSPFRRLVPAIGAALALACLPASAADDQTTLVYPPFGHCLGIHKVTDFHRFIYLGARTQIDDPAGIAAVKLESKDDPSTEGDDDELTVFGLNSGRCEIIFNTSIYEADIYGGCGSGEGQFRAPLGIAADPDGNVFVADTGNDRVVRLLYDDDSLRWIKVFNAAGPGEGTLSRPAEVALGASGTLYVCDAGNDRVVVMSPEGEHRMTIYGDADAGLKLEGPLGLACVEADDPWISRHRDFIAVSDRGGQRLSTFDREGNLLHSIVSTDVPADGARFESLAIDFYGNVYATDRAGGRIHKLDRELRYVTSFGRSGAGNGEFDEPRGITLWKRFGQVFVTERSGAQYLWIGTDILDLMIEPGRLRPGGGPAWISYRLTETSRVTIEVVDGRGRTVATLVSDRRRPTGANTERWDGARGADGPLSPGDYAIRVRARPTYSSGKYFHDNEESPFYVTEPAAP